TPFSVQLSVYSTTSADPPSTGYRRSSSKRAGSANQRAYSARIASAPAACSRQLGTVASSVASALHTSQPPMSAVSIACRNLSITGLPVMVASLRSLPSWPPRLAARLQPYPAVSRDESRVTTTVHDFENMLFISVDITAFAH